jgi:hypothetical protein
MDGAGDGAGDDDFAFLGHGDPPLERLDVAVDAE